MILAMMSPADSSSSPAKPDIIRDHSGADKVIVADPLAYVFEGVEKRVELQFSVSNDDPNGLRALPSHTWDGVCDLAKCTIVRHEKLGQVDSYILSESTLLVFRARVMIKTCGATVPLNAVDFVVRVASVVGASLARMVYSRGRFLYPSLQWHPHNRPDTESRFVAAMTISGHRVTGQWASFSDSDGPYWSVHMKDFPHVPVHPISNRITVEVLMTGLSPESRARYFRDKSQSDSYNEERMGESLAGIDPSFTLSGISFDPCGYSCNAHSPSNEDYFTIHVTPEAEFSYASAEAVFALSVDGINYDLVMRVQRFVGRAVRAFDPSAVAVTLTSPNDRLAAGHLPIAARGYLQTQSSMHILRSSEGAPPTVASAAQYAKISSARERSDFPRSKL